MIFIPAVIIVILMILFLDMYFAKNPDAILKHFTNNFVLE
jgi:hypothetical protein